MTPLFHRIILRASAAALFLALAPAAYSQGQPIAAPPLRATWKGQVKSDRAGTGAALAPNGINDLLITVDGASLASSFPIQWSIHASTPLQVYFDRAWPPTARSDGAILVEERGGSYDLYFEPGLFVAGDVLTVAVGFADGSHQEGKVVGDGVRWGAVAMWCGQTDKDFVGDETDGDDGCRDWMIAVTDPGFQARKVAAWRLWLDYPGHDDFFNAFWSFSSEEGPAMGGRPLRAEPKADGALLFFNPALAREGDEFIVEAIMNDGSTIAWALAGGGTDWGQAAIYYGRTTQDTIGELEAKPNGVNDIQLEMFDPKLGGGVLKCVVSSNGKRWMYPLDAYDADSPDGEETRLLKADAWGDRTRLTLDDSGDQAGQFYFISAVLKNGEMLGWAVMTTRTNNSSDATWLGQQGDSVGLGESAAPDGDPDLAIIVRHPLLGVSNVKQWKVEGGGKRWGGDDKSGVSPVVADDGVSGGEKTVRFAEPGSGPFRRAEKFLVTAVLDDGNVINWRLASPGSPTLRGLRWEKPTNTRYAIRMESSASGMRSVKVSDKGRAHTWRSAAGDGQAADAQVSSGSGGVSISLDRAKATLAPGAALTVELTDRNGVRHYGTCFVGAME